MSRFVNESIQTGLMNCCFDLFQIWRGREGLSNSDRGSWRRGGLSDHFINESRCLELWTVAPQMEDVVDEALPDPTHDHSLLMLARVPPSRVYQHTQSRLSERVKPALRHMIRGPFPPFLAMLGILRPSITFDWSGCCSVCDWWRLWHGTSPPALLRKRVKKGLSVSLIFL